ncbi:MAG: dihydroorotate dehydrogenase-like protein [Pirellula sp.]
MTIDLSTRYLKRTLKNPLVVSACPLTGSIKSLQELEEVGASAVVLQSLFAEQIEHEENEIFRLHSFAEDSSPESSSYFPELENYNTGPEPHLEFLERAKKAIGIPVIASLNGTSPGKWVKFARLFELAGADALELNIYFVSTNPMTSGNEVEKRYIDIVTQVSANLSIPLAVKIGPYFSSIPHFAKKLVDAGADGIVLFNRYLDPDIDLELLRVQPHLELSQPSELRLVLRWLGILRDQLTCSLAATSGIHTAAEALKALLAGANVTMMASALLRNGPKHLATVLEDLTRWLESNQYSSIQELIGSLSRDRGADASSFERGNYMKALVSYSNKG